MKTFAAISAICVVTILSFSPAFARRGNPDNPGKNTAPKMQYYLIDSDQTDDTNAPTYAFVDTLTDAANWHRIKNFTNNDDGFGEAIYAPDSLLFVYMDAGSLRLPPRYISTNGMMKLTLDSNAVLGFGAPVTTPTNGPIPTTGANPLGPVICPLWGDMEFRTAGDSTKVFYRMTSDACYVTYYNLALKGSNGQVRATFQTVFSLKDSSITFNYKTFDGNFNGTPADSVFMNECTIGVQNYRSIYGTMYLDRGTYYAISTGSQTYAKNLRAGLAVKFMRVIPHLIRMRSIDNPAYDGYELPNNSFSPQCTLENFTSIDRFVVVKTVITRISDGFVVRSSTDSVEVTNRSTGQLTAAVYQGFPCGAYHVQMTASIPSVGADGWIADNIMSRDFVYLKTLTAPFYDNFSTILDPCNWHSYGATWVNASDVMCDPPSPYSTGAALLDRLDAKNQPYLSTTSSDTLTSVTFNLKNLTNVWLSFSYQRGLCTTDSAKAGIRSRVTIGPEPLVNDSLDIGIYQGDSLRIEGLVSTGTALNDTNSGDWMNIATIFGGIDKTTKRYRVQLDAKVLHDHSRFRFRLCAKDDHPKYGFPLDDNDSWIIDAIQISAPTNGQTDLEPLGIDLGNGPFTHIPRNTKLISPIVTIGNNGLLTNAGAFVVHVLIKDQLQRSVYDKTQTIVTPPAHTTTQLAMPVWDIQGSQGGNFSAKINIAQDWNDYYKTNDTNTFYRTMYIDSVYALDDGSSDVAGPMATADNSFYYDFVPLANDSLRAIHFYHLTASGITNWTISILDTSIAPPRSQVVATKSFSYNVQAPGFIRGAFTTGPFYVSGGVNYRMQCIMTQGSGLGGDASKGLMWEKRHSFNNPLYDALYPSIVSSFRTSSNFDYLSANRNAANGGPLLPMMRLEFQGRYTYLPVEIVHFGAARTDNGSVDLVFKTAKEESLDRFEIDRESVSGWVNVGTISAKNNRIGADYALIDEKAPSSRLTYRLMEVDLDGSTKLVGTTAVGSNGLPEAFGANVFPNPASQNIHVMLTGTDDASVTLYDALGKIVATRDHAGYSTDIDASSLSAGSYWLEARSGENVTRVKVAVTK
ncbi:MAG: T9SS type A sorting domain-containing protein [bacterium]